jgi:hypothetical protein
MLQLNCSQADEPFCGLEGQILSKTEETLLPEVLLQ